MKQLPNQALQCAKTTETGWLWPLSGGRYSCTASLMLFAYRCEGINLVLGCTHMRWRVEGQVSSTTCPGFDSRFCFRDWFLLVVDSIESLLINDKQRNVRKAWLRSFEPLGALHGTHWLESPSPVIYCGAPTRAILLFFCKAITFIEQRENRNRFGPRFLT